jgi:hypothetical protein
MADRPFPDGDNAPNNAHIGATSEFDVTSGGIQPVAAATGFSSAGSVRRAFLRFLGITRKPIERTTFCPLPDDSVVYPNTWPIRNPSL